MFYEIEDYAVNGKNTNKVKKYLIDLTEIAYLEEIEHCSESSYCAEYWFFEIYAKHDDNTWTFNYLTERDARQAWNNLKEAIRQTIGIFEPKNKVSEKTNPNDTPVILTNEVNLFEESLRNLDSIDIPEVKLCE